MTNEELRDALTVLAKRSGFSITEIDYMARIIVLADHDPLPPSKWGDPFEFASRKVSVFNDPHDFHCINPNVPKPDAQVDLLLAWQEFGMDATNTAAIYASRRELSVMQNWRLFLNSWDWFRFWSARHPNPDARMKFAQALLHCDELATRMADNAVDRVLRSHGTSPAERGNADQ